MPVLIGPFPVEWQQQLILIGYRAIIGRADCRSSAICHLHVRCLLIRTMQSARGPLDLGS